MVLDGQFFEAPLVSSNSWSTICAHVIRLQFAGIIEVC